ncbi:hypothetical protein B0T09DRAFT_348121 [Sordaria sp. MPI-SDFR-AT-0083]|nr:hypothetical protein B0T09DRAFT_348121 [Sordaria sp. MPI-SDFR-AT-0083]
MSRGSGHGVLGTDRPVCRSRHSGIVHFVLTIHGRRRLREGQAALAAWNKKRSRSGFLEGLEYARTYATINWWDGAHQTPPLATRRTAGAQVEEK